MSASRRDRLSGWFDHQHVELDIGIRLAETGEHRAQHIIEQRVIGGHPQQARGLVVAPGDAPLEIGDVAAHAFGQRHHFLAGGGGGIAVARTLEQFGADHRLKRAEAAKHRRMIEIERRRGSHQGPGFRNAPHQAKIVPTDLIHAAKMVQFATKRKARRIFSPLGAAARRRRSLIASPRSTSGIGRHGDIFRAALIERAQKGEKIGRRLVEIAARRKVANYSRRAGKTAAEIQTRLALAQDFLRRAARLRAAHNGKPAGPAPGVCAVAPLVRQACSPEPLAARIARNAARPQQARRVVKQRDNGRFRRRPGRRRHRARRRCGRRDRPAHGPASPG